MRAEVKKDLTADYVRQLLDYDPDAGLLRWKQTSLRPKTWNTRFAGEVAGCLTKLRSNYSRIELRIDDKLYLAHRIAWLIVTGEWPAQEIDHINGDGADNRWSNLREANHAQNSRNRRIQSNNSSGFIGVRYRPHHKKWEARITINKKTVWRLYSDTAQEAAAARRVALPQFHGDFASER
jgi:hypothetical protein